MGVRTRLPNPIVQTKGGTSLLDRSWSNKWVRLPVRLSDQCYSPIKNAMVTFDPTAATGPWSDFGRTSGHTRPCELFRYRYYDRSLEQVKTILKHLPSPCRKPI
ncbi:hypothetical protein PTTG_26491 [Puccinia triticina 1-1 BBBD Race 1]|uniref:Uncharacterized protein n=1 Tax=Puccinia triticina (isolate 1-1 / race 1 (BBBD)) TaxID=630390 RepID=A0A180GUM7_PUCT1|nr:hypothetical protein PTTG_26491 [Puccinia triticina 1-1 BBBD Race 1]